MFTFMRTVRADALDATNVLDAHASNFAVAGTGTCWNRFPLFMQNAATRFSVPPNFLAPPFAFCLVSLPHGCRYAFRNGTRTGFRSVSPHSAQFGAAPACCIRVRSGQHSNTEPPALWTRYVDTPYLRVPIFSWVCSSCGLATVQRWSCYSPFAKRILDSLRGSFLPFLHGHRCGYALCRVLRSLLAAPLRIFALGSLRETTRADAFSTAAAYLCVPPPTVLTDVRLTFTSLRMHSGCYI